MPFVIMVTGQLIYVIAWLAFLVSSLGTLNNFQPVVYAAGPIIIWVAWWIRRALSAKFSLFFGFEWEFPKFAKLLAEWTWGFSNTFWFQALLVICWVGCIGLIS